MDNAVKQRRSDLRLRIRVGLRRLRFKFSGNAAKTPDLPSRASPIPGFSFFDGFQLARHRAESPAVR
jgi:hypothetical protein